MGTVQPEGSVPDGGSPGSGCVNAPLGTDISRAGRALPNGGLRPGDTFSTVISSPTYRKFYRGYTLVLSTGSDNIMFGGTGDQVAVGTFEYFSYGKWSTTAGATRLYDTDTSTNGVQIDITLTGTNTFHARMTPLGLPELVY